MTQEVINFIGLILFLSGFIIGLGAVTVIDLLGFLSRKSEYWTEATTRTHKVTKPLIWLGIFLVLIGGVIFFRNEPLNGIRLYHLLLVIVLVANGSFLSYRVSPYLLEREKKGESSKLLPKSWQNKIAVSFIISFLGWWSGVLLLVFYLVSNY